jgi:hypothetical protein
MIPSGSADRRRPLQEDDTMNILFTYAITDAETLLSTAYPSSFCEAIPKYRGTCVDTGADVSVAGALQYAAYFRHSALPISQLPAATVFSKTMFRFGTQIFESTYIARIRFHVVPVAVIAPGFFEFEVHVIPLDCPVLLGLDVIIASKIHIDSKNLQLRTDIWTAQLQLKQGHLFVRQHNELLFNRHELTRMHVALAHLSADKLLHLLKVERPKNTPRKPRHC